MCDITGFILRSSWLWSGGKKHVRVPFSFSLATRGPADCDDWCILTSLETYLLHISHKLYLVPLGRYVRVVVLPCPEATRCLFRTHSSQAHDTLELNEVFAVQLSPTAFRQKTLRVDVCSTTKSRREECLVGVLKTSLCICTGPSSHDLKKNNNNLLWSVNPKIPLSSTCYWVLLFRKIRRKRLKK